MALVRFIGLNLKLCGSGVTGGLGNRTVLGHGGATRGPVTPPFTRTRATGPSTDKADKSLHALSDPCISIAPPAGRFPTPRCTAAAAELRCVTITRFDAVGVEGGGGLSVHTHAELRRSYERHAINTFFHAALYGASGSGCWDPAAPRCTGGCLTAALERVLQEVGSGGRGCGLPLLCVRCPQRLCAAHPALTDVFLRS